MRTVIETAGETGSVIAPPYRPNPFPRPQWRHVDRATVTVVYYTASSPKPRGAVIDDTGSEREFFATHGWLVVRDVVPRAEVMRTARALDAIVPEASYLVGYAGHVVEIAGISRGSAEIARHSVLPAIGRLAARALDARRVQLLQDSVLIKPPGGGPVEWHQDGSYLGYLDRPAVVTVRLSLTPCTNESGCLRVIDGSHGWGLAGADLSFRRSSIEDTLVGLPPERRASARDAEVALELGPGDVSLHHCLTFHGSAVNHSTWPRKTLVMRFMDAECRLVPERLPERALASRFPVDDTGRFSAAAFPVVHDDVS